MSVRPEQWLDESLSIFQSELQNGLKVGFDDEAFRPSPNYQRLAEIGNLIENPEFKKELEAAWYVLENDVLEVLEKYGLSQEDLPSLFAPKPVVTHFEPPFIPVTPVVPQLKTPEEKSRDIKPAEVPLALQGFIPAIKELVIGTKPPRLLIAALQSAPNMKAKEQIFEFALTQLGRARIKKEIKPNKFHSRFSQLTSLDPSRNHKGGPSYEIIKEILDKLNNSSNPEESELGRELFSVISTGALERKLQKADIEFCGPERMVNYLGDAAYHINKVDISVESDEVPGEYEESLKIENSEELEDILEILMDRADDELDFLEDIICLLRDKGYLRNSYESRNISYVEEALQILADKGCESAIELLDSAWLDLT